MIIESIVILLSFQLSIITLSKYWSNKKSDRNRMVLGIGLLFFSFAFTLMIYTITDFFIYDMELRPNVVIIGYMSIILGILGFTYFSEKEMGSRYYIFTIIMSAFLILLILDIFLNFVSRFLIIFPSIFPIFIEMVIYTKKFTSMVKGKWKLNVYGLIIGSAVAIIGFGLTSDIFLSIWLWFRLIGDLCILGGIVMISFFIIGLPSLTELGWVNKILNAHLFIMYKNGICLYDYSFKKDANEELNIDEQSQIITGGISSIIQILQTMIQSDKRLEVVDYKNKKIMFEYGEYIICILIVDVALKILQAKLQELINQFEDYFSDYLKNWSGKLLNFEIVRKMIKQIFKV